MLETKHRPRRRFSQNFLVDRNYIERIVRSVAPAQGQCLVEIGPGLGALTQPLLEIVGKLTAIEIDRDAARVLQGRFANAGLTVLCQDFLTFDLASLGTQLRVVGNLPYHISTPILFAVDGFRKVVRDCHFMLQQEVVDRMVASPATKDYGRLSVMLQLGWHMTKLFDVPPTAFRPQPKVWSSVVRMSPAENASVLSERIFASIVEAAFSKRRKTLRNALREVVTGDDFDAAAIDPQRRGETLSVSEFASLTNRVYSRLSVSSG